MNYLERHKRDLAMRSEYERGASLRAIGERYGLTPEGVAYALKRMETPLRGRGRPRDGKT